MADVVAGAAGGKDISLTDTAKLRLVPIHTHPGWHPLLFTSCGGRGLDDEADSISHNRHRGGESLIAGLEDMPFRVLVFGSPSFHDYAKLRSILDVALSKRLPDVVLVTTGGSGLPALVASYARSRNLAVEVTPIERYPLDVRKSPMVGLVGKIEAAVIVWPEIEPATKELLDLIEAKSLPVYVVPPPRDEGGTGKNRGGGRCVW